MMESTTTGTLTFSNPRRDVMIEDWPIGRQRCRAHFVVVSAPRGASKERVARWTENKTRTGWNAPKCTTYACACAIVDGSDGRTYILARTSPKHIFIWHGNLKHQYDSIFHGDPTFASLDFLVQNVAE